jgi:methylmalonyl-CoA mutase
LSSSPISFTDGFAPATRADWAALVEKTLKGPGVETLASPTADGLSIAPLGEASQEATAFVPAPRGGERPWDIRTRVRHPSVAAARDAALEDLAGGAASVILALRQPEQEGVAISSAETMAAALDGVLIDLAPVGLDAGYLGPQAADWLSDAAKGSPAAPLALHFDPLSTFARTGASPGPIESHLISAAGTAARLAQIHPNASLFLASGQVVHEAAGGPAEELAFALAAALAYLKALTRAGLSMESAASGIVLGVATDTDPLMSIAKLRAARMVWARLTAACGADTPAKIEARASQRMLTRAEPWTNLVRLTAAGLAAVVGGADAVVLGAFTDALGLPGRLARRMARNTQLILMEEGHLGAVADPTAGAGAFETLSLDLARAAWRRFNAIEAAGGIVAALRDGVITREAEAERGRLAEALQAGAQKIVGVTDFQAAEIRAAAVETAPKIETPPPEPRLPGPDSHGPALAPILLEELAA